MENNHLEFASCNKRQKNESMYSQGLGMLEENNSCVLSMFQAIWLWDYFDTRPSLGPGTIYI